MKLRQLHTGFAIAIAWPQTYCKQPGSWYDSLMSLIGVNHNNYYQVGHAALVLINATNGDTHYFDFGRYHAPFKNGRVRGAITDNELVVKTKAQISSDGKSITNYTQILTELQLNPACHGEGRLHASYCSINYDQSYQKVIKMQQAPFIPYGPFKRKGSNCSRFVQTAILAGSPAFKHQFALQIKVPFTPTPISNTLALNHQVIIPKLQQSEAFNPILPLSKTLQQMVIPQPEKHNNIPKNAQWLSGEGAGSWYCVSLQDKQLLVTRYSPDAIIESQGLYLNNNYILQHNNTFEISYPSNSNVVTLQTQESKITFKRVPQE